MSYYDDPIYQTIQKVCTTKFIGDQLAQAYRNRYHRQLLTVRLLPKLIHYNPFMQATATVKAIMADPHSQTSMQTHDLFLHIFATPEAATVALETAQTAPAAPMPAFCIPDRYTIAWAIPSVPHLPELAHLLQPEQFCHIFSLPIAVKNIDPPTLHCYTPLERAVLSWNHSRIPQRYFAKLYQAGSAAIAAHNLQQVDCAGLRGELDFASPSLIAWNESYHALLMTDVAGEPLTDSSFLSDLDVLGQVGYALAQLNQSAVEPHLAWQPEIDLARLRCQAKAITAVLPEFAYPLDLLLARIEDVSNQFDFPLTIPTHGNLVTEHILVSKEGIGFISWDKLASGDGYRDLGSLLAQLIYFSECQRLFPATVQALAAWLLQAYVAKMEQTLDWERLLWHVAVQLLFRVQESSIRPLTPGWQGHIACAFAEANKLLAGTSRFLPHSIYNYVQNGLIS